MASEVRVSVFSETLPASELRRLVSSEPDRKVSVCGPIPPLHADDTRERVAEFSHLSWTAKFSDDGSEAVADMLDGLGIDWNTIGELRDRTAWVVAFLFSSDSSGDQIIFDGRLLDLLLRLDAEFYVKTI